MHHDNFCVWKKSAITFDEGCTIDQSHKSHNITVPYPTLHHSEQKFAYICSKWCIVWYETDALLALLIWSIAECLCVHFRACMYVPRHIYWIVTVCSNYVTMVSWHWHIFCVTGLLGVEFTAHIVMWALMFFALAQKKLLGKQWSCQWFEMPQRNDILLVPVRKIQRDLNCGTKTTGFGMIYSRSLLGFRKRFHLT